MIVNGVRMMIEKQVINRQHEQKFTKFWDMHSGGSQKLEWSKVYVNLSESEARVWFQSKFNRDCDHVTCAHCGKDYSVSTADTLEELTHFHRNEIYKHNAEKSNPNMSYDEYHKLGYDVAITLDEYLTLPDVLYVDVTIE